jgi:hypothetical protein
VDLVVALAKSPRFAETPASRQKLVDLALQARARSALRAGEGTSHVDILIEVSAGRLGLTGIVADDAEKAKVMEVLSALPGTAGIDDQLRTMTGGMYRFPSQTKGYPSPSGST